MPNKILIVDDEPFNLDLLEQELQDQGYVIERATDGAEALEKVPSFLPDVILLDYMMPNMNGLEVLGRLRKDEKHKGIPVILLTAKATQEDKIRGLDAGADDYVVKPFDSFELMARVRAMIRIKEMHDLLEDWNRYHAEMGKLIFEYGGTLERFAGDGIMIFFNDPVLCPDHTEKAIRMALEMQLRVAELRKGWLKRGYDLDLGIGLAAGYATLGNVGFEGRVDYGASGNVTNLTARLCGEATGGQILVDRKTLSRIEDLVEVEPGDGLTLKGFPRPVAAFNIIRTK